MKLLLDQNISFRVARKLQHTFPVCLHVSDCGLNDCEDSEIWEYARSNGFTIVTFDADFYDISVLRGHPPKIIWLRSGNLTKVELATLLADNQALINQFVSGTEMEDASCLELS